MQDQRPSWNQYFMRIAEVVASRSTCLRRHVGAILVQNKRILATGYNGAPKGLEHCRSLGCLREQLRVPSGQRHELCRGLHAEQNVLLQAAVYGVSTQGSDLYCTHVPCSICAKMLINANIRRVYFKEGYPDKQAQMLLQEAQMQLVGV